MTDPAPGDEDLVGQTLGEHYRVGSRLGAGTMGVVYRVTHTLLRRDFAAKVLASTLSGDPGARARFVREAESLVRLAHPNIVTVRHFGEHRGRPYIVMDLCEGETLAALLAREGTLEPTRAVTLALEILRALDAAHWEGIVHRDLKPANVIVGPSEPGGDGRPRVRVLDFGLARVQPAPRQAGVRDTQPGVVAGTMAYMAPEQVRAERDVDARCDLFALGCMLHEMLAGHAPFAGASPLTTAMAILDRPAPTLRADGPRAVPPALDAVVAKALAKERDARYASAGEMAEALRAALAEAGAPAASPTSASGKGPRRLLGWSVALAAVVVGAWGVQRIVQGTGTGAGDAAPEVAADRELAWRAFLDARFEQAVEAAQRVVAGSQGRTEDLLLLASAAAELGRDDAGSLLDRVQERTGPTPRLAVERARWLGGDWEPDLRPALAALERGLHGPADAETRLVRVWLVHRQLRRHAQEGGSEAERVRLVAQLEDDARALGDGAAGGVAQALAAQMRGEGEAAYGLARAAVERDPDLADAPFAAALIAHELGRALPRAAHADEARRWFERSLADAGEAVARARRRPREGLQGRHLVRFWRQICNVRQDLGDKEGASATWEAEVLARNPGYAPDLQVGAQYLQWAGRYDDALVRYAQARAAGRGDELLHGEGYCHLQRGQLLADAGDVRGALAALDAAVAKFSAGAARAPDEPVHLAYRAEALLARSRAQREDAAALDLARAGEDFATLERAGKAALPEVLFRRWEVHQALGDQAAALADARAALAGEGVTAAHHRRLAWSCLASAVGPEAPGLLAEALRAASDAERWNPQRGELCCLIRGHVHAAWARLEAQEAARKERRAQARAELEKAIALAALDTRVRAEAELALAGVLAEEGAHDAALERAEAALRLRTEPAPTRGSAFLPHDAFLRSPLTRFHERLAQAYRRVGNDADALRQEALARALR